MERDIQLIIVPDVHGRSFWKEVLKDNPTSEVIFLGDYVDPYEHEGITDEATIEGLKEIIELKKSRPSSVRLLLGNHDFSYIEDRLVCSRHNYQQEWLISGLYQSNIDLFEIAYEKEIAAKKFLFSHAGVSEGWIDANSRFFEKGKVCAEYFNELYRDPSTRKAFVAALDEVSDYRGGYSDFGSMIWADVREMITPNTLLNGYVHVFGHTQLTSSPLRVGDSLYCLDCRKAFYIDSQGVLRDYATGEEVQQTNRIRLC